MTNDDTTAPVRYEMDGAVCAIVLDHPESMNSLDTPTKVALRDAVLRAAGDESVRAVVLAATGRAFSVGQDLKEHAQALESGDSGLIDTVHDHYNPTVHALATMPKPVVAAINGVAAGAGASYTFSCDLRIVADTGGFNLAFAGIGLSCDTGTSWTLPRLVGWAKARELLFLPRTVPADEALTLGLASEVVPAGQEYERAVEIAQRLADGPTVAYAAMRKALAFSASHTFEESLEYEAGMMQTAGDTEDHREAVQAFIDKRHPVFHGR